MKKNMLELVQDISDDAILEFAEVKPQKQKVIYIKRYIVACIALIFTIGIVTSVAVEAKEYKQAVAFFEENNLSTENLSRTEIKSIYKDIITETFTYEKTTELIVSSVQGYEVVQEDISTEDLVNLWNNISNKDFYFQTQEYTGIYYIADEYKFSKYDDDLLLWELDFDGYFVNNYINVDENILVYANKDKNSTTEKDYSLITLINQNGEIIWQNELEDLDICNVVYSNEEIAVFSRRALEYFCFNKYDISGNLLEENETALGNKGIWNAVAFGNDYLVEIANNGIQEIVKVSSSGEMLESFSYYTEEYHYSIQDMIVWNGNIFFSAYSVPIENAGYASDEIRDICDFAVSNNITGNSDELTEKVKANYNAILLVFNENLESPQIFYTISGSLGAEFEIDSDNNLIWNVETIMDTFFSFGTSSFSIGGSSLVYKCSFNQDGNLINYEKTEELVDFRK